jgi:hypothetical protein
MRERDYQAGLIKRIKRRFPGCVVVKNDPNYIQGFPDLLLLFGHQWAVLEVKPSIDAPYQPNQEYHLRLLGEMSIAAMICPENEEEVLDELQLTFTAGW